MKMTATMRLLQEQGGKAGGEAFKKVLDVLGSQSKEHGRVEHGRVNQEKLPQCREHRREGREHRGLQDVVYWVHLRFVTQSSHR